MTTYNNYYDDHLKEKLYVRDMGAKEVFSMFMLLYYSFVINQEKKCDCFLAATSNFKIAFL